jgi:hypothetical protein
MFQMPNGKMGMMDECLNVYLARSYQQPLINKVLLLVAVIRSTSVAFSRHETSTHVASLGELFVISPIQSADATFRRGNEIPFIYTGFPFSAVLT